MPETPEELYTRVQRDGLRMPPVQEWETWPFDGELRPRALEPPVDAEASRTHHLPLHKREPVGRFCDV